MDIEHIHYTYVFLNPANSDTENGIKKNQKCHLKKIMYSGNWKTGKTKNELNVPE